MHWQRMCPEPQNASCGGRVNANFSPPTGFIGAAMYLAMMSAAQWDSKFIAYLTLHGVVFHFFGTYQLGSVMGRSGRFSGYVLATSSFGTRTAVTPGKCGYQSGTREKQSVPRGIREKITPFSSVGLGGRYWHMESNDNTHFEVVGGIQQPVTWKSDIFEVFLQGSILFGVYPDGDLGPAHSNF
jgi:hypothetical protein